MIVSFCNKIYPAKLFQFSNGHCGVKKYHCFDEMQNDKVCKNKNKTLQYNTEMGWFKVDS